MPVETEQPDWVSVVPPELGATLRAAWGREGHSGNGSHLSLPSDSTSATTNAFVSSVFNTDSQPRERTAAHNFSPRWLISSLPVSDCVAVTFAPSLVWFGFCVSKPGVCAARLQYTPYAEASFSHSARKQFTPFLQAPCWCVEFAHSAHLCVAEICTPACCAHIPEPFSFWH